MHVYCLPTIVLSISQREIILCGQVNQGHGVYRYVDGRNVCFRVISLLAILVRL